RSLRRSRIGRAPDTAPGGAGARSPRWAARAGAARGRGSSPRAGDRRAWRPRCAEAVGERTVVEQQTVAVGAVLPIDRGGIAGATVGAHRGGLVEEHG